MKRDKLDHLSIVWPAHRLRSRICIVGNQAFSLLNFRGHLITELVSRGFEVFALAPDYDEATRMKVCALGARPIPCSLSRAGMDPIRDFADLLNLALLLHRLKPGIVLTYSIKPVIYGTLAAWLARVPGRFTIIEGLGYAFVMPEGQKHLGRKMLRGFICIFYAIALACASRAIFLNNDDMEYFLKRHIVSHDKVLMLGGIGVDITYWKPAPPIKEPLTFLLAARLLREKGIVVFAEAAKLIKQKHPDTRFILLGCIDTNPGALSRQEIEKWTAEGILEWPGHVPDVRFWMEKASVFVLPSYYREGVPRSIQEAMAMARAIITTNEPGCRDTVVDGENGFLISSRDTDALAAAMEQFIQHPQLIESMGKASRRIAEERFDVRKINQTIMKEMGIYSL